MVASMLTQIILLRGVMPTGKNKVPMPLLRVALEKAGLQDVRTYIQSGNIVVSSDLDQLAMEGLVHDVISDNFGGDIVVFARTATYFKNALVRNPFAGADSSKLYFTLLSAKPERDLLQQFLAPGYSPDKVEIIDDMVHVLCATTYSDAKINNNFIERRLKVSATTRVYNTISNLVKLAEQ